MNSLMGGLEEMMAAGDNLDFGASGEEGLGGDDEDLLMLQKAVQNALDKKKQAVVKKQAAVLEEARAGAQKRVAALEAMIVKENEAALAEARKRVEAEKGRAVKMPQLAKLLQSLM